MSRIHFSFLVCLMIALAVPRFFGQQNAAPSAPKNLPLYLPIGNSSMAGRPEIPEDVAGIIDLGEVATVDAAVPLLKRAIAFGEHYGKDLMFDDPKNLMLYEACEKAV